MIGLPFRPPSNNKLSLILLTFFVTAGILGSTVFAQGTQPPAAQTQTQAQTTTSTTNLQNNDPSQLEGKSLNDIVNQSIPVPDESCSLWSCVKAAGTWMFRLAMRGFTNFSLYAFGYKTEAKITTKSLTSTDPHRFDYLVDANGLLPSSAAVLSAMAPQNNPVSFSNYLASINPLTATTAHASGVDDLYNVPWVLKMWQYMLNIAYVFMVVVIVAIGFMIMFRFNIDPRTVVTIENSVPRVIVALVLMTFSFAFAGLAIDLSRLLSTLAFPTDIGFETAGSLINGIGTGIAQSQTFTTVILETLSSVVVILISMAVGGGTVLMVFLLALLLIGYLLVVLIFNIIFQLARKYAEFIIFTIIAPIIFALGALPNLGSLTSGWFKRMLALLMSITGTFFVIWIALRIMNQPLTMLPSPIAAGWSTQNWVDWLVRLLFNNVVVGFAILFYATKIPAIVDEVLGIKELGARAGLSPAGIIAATSGERGLVKGLQSMGGKAKTGLNVAGAAGKSLMSGRELATGGRMSRLGALSPFTRNGWKIGLNTKGLLSSNYGMSGSGAKIENLRKGAAAVLGYGGDNYNDFLDTQSARERSQAISTFEGEMKSNDGDFSKALNKTARKHNALSYSDLVQKTRSGNNIAASQTANIAAAAAAAAAAPEPAMARAALPNNYNLPDVSNSIHNATMSQPEYESNLLKIASILNTGNATDPFYQAKTEHIERAARILEEQVANANAYLKASEKAAAEYTTRPPRPNF